MERRFGALSVQETAMTDDLVALRRETEMALAEADDLRALEAVRVRMLGKGGRLTSLLKQLGTLPAEERRKQGAALNSLKEEISALIEARKQVLEAAELNARLAQERFDITLPPRPQPQGFIHPITRTIEEMVAIFGAMGFEVAEGPDIETDWHNFSALNIPEHHPARTEHDTFYLPGKRDGRPLVLRTHTSTVQIITMLSRNPPFRIIAPGRAYRADHDATHSPMFHQCEGLVIDRNITLAHLKGCLVDFLRAFFSLPELAVRFRASYFPFTEPSMEVDIGWDRASGKLGQGSDWLEILGSGMVHPRVLANCGLDPREWQGFAFGMGVERLTMLKHGITDLRNFFESDIRWLRHYGANPLSPAILHEGI